MYRRLGAEQISLLILRQLLYHLRIVLSPGDNLKLLSEKRRLETLKTIGLLLFCDETLDFLQTELMLGCLCFSNRRGDCRSLWRVLLMIGLLRLWVRVVLRSGLILLFQSIHELLQCLSCCYAARLVCLCGRRSRRGRRRQRSFR